MVDGDAAPGPGRCATRRRALGAEWTRGSVPFGRGGLIGCAVVGVRARVPRGLSVAHVATPLGTSPGADRFAPATAHDPPTHLAYDLWTALLDAPAALVHGRTGYGLGDPGWLGNQGLNREVILIRQTADFMLEPAGTMEIDDHGVSRDDGRQPQRHRPLEGVQPERNAPIGQWFGQSREQPDLVLGRVHLSDVFQCRRQFARLFTRPAIGCESLGNRFEDVVAEVL